MQDTVLPASTVNTIPEPYSHGYLYGSSSFVSNGRTALLARRPGCGTSWHLLAEGLHGCEPFLRRGRWGCHFHRQRSRHYGSRHSSAARCSTPTINADGSTACSPRTRASPKAKNTGTASAKLAGDRTRFIFTAARPRLQLENQLRPGQQPDAHHLDQSDCITRRPADRQYPLGEDARSRLQSVTASISAGLNARASNSPTSQSGSS